MEDQHVDRRSFQLVLIDGTRVDATVETVWQVMTDRNSLTFFIIAAAIVGYLYPLDHLLMLEWWQRSISISISLLLLLGALGLFASGLFSVAKRLSGFAAPVPLLLFAALATMETSMQYVNHFLWHSAISSPQTLMKIIVTNYLWLLCFEVLFSVFAFPKTKVGKTMHRRGDFATGDSVTAGRAFVESDDGLAPGSKGPSAGPASLRPRAPLDPYENMQTDVARDDVAPNAAPIPAAAPPALRIAGMRLSLDQLYMIKSEEHYIRIMTTAGEHLHRFRISDAVAVLPETAGLQVHRSAWVNFRFVCTTMPMPHGKLLLTLANSERVVVPKARRKLFEDRFAQFQIESSETAVGCS